LNILILISDSIENTPGTIIEIFKGSVDCTTLDASFSTDWIDGEPQVVMGLVR